MAASCCRETPGAPLCSAAEDPARARRRRADAARKYRPEKVRLLIVAEAPPGCLQRYFYFEDVVEHDALFRYVVQEVLEVKPSRTGKTEHLEQLRDAGVWLVDLKADPKVKGEKLRLYVDDLVTRVTAADPEHIVLVKVGVYDAAYRKLAEAGLPVVGERIDFPSSGRQKEFERGMRRALKRIGWQRPGDRN